MRPGARGVVRLLGVVPVPARIGRVRDDGVTRAWDWQVGPVRMDHELVATPGGCRISLTIEGPEAIVATAGRAYEPAVRLLLGNLARVAEAGG